MMSSKIRKCKAFRSRSTPERQMGGNMKRFIAVLLMVSAGTLVTAWAQRIGIETNEKHNVATAERRIKGSPVATMEVAGVKITYPQIAVNPIPGFTDVGGNIEIGRAS